MRFAWLIVALALLLLVAGVAYAQTAIGYDDGYGPDVPYIEHPPNVVVPTTDVKISGTVEKMGEKLTALGVVKVEYDNGDVIYALLNKDGSYNIDIPKDVHVRITAYEGSATNARTYLVKLYTRDVYPADVKGGTSLKLDMKGA